MKLTAPPPGSVPDQPPEETPAAAAASPDAPSPAVPYQKPPDRVAAWPTWFGPADAFLAVGVLVIAFLAASFTARNSDIWLHLASGKRLLAGDYKLGSDPFSYTAADRTWVNHSWLWDVGAYSLFSGDGFLLVLLKALAAAGAFGLVFLIRRPGHSMWPWTIFTALAILAGSYLLTLRPYAGSFFLLALTLLLVFRLKRGLPFAIAGVFALWSNIDAWFILGPGALLLITIGEAIRVKLWPEAHHEPADGLGSLPGLPTLVKTLLIGSAACMINPHHIGVWELPFELMGAPSGAEGDPRVNAAFSSPLMTYTRFWWSEELGFSAAGIAYAILLLAGLYTAFLSGVVGRVLGFAQVDPMPVPQLLLWLGFAALSLLTIYGIPFFVLVSVPLLASRCNVASSHFQLGLQSDSGTHLRMMASSAGRLASVLALLLMGLIAMPGWLHPPASAWWVSAIAHPANTRRVEWKIEADPELRQAAEWLQSARANGSLPAESRGLIASLDFANYCAWFAPSEKVFANSRLAFHRPDLPEFAKARRGLGAFTEKSEPPDLRETEEVIAKWNATYVGVAWLHTDFNRAFLERQVEQGWVIIKRWSPWFFNGRSAISGWRKDYSSGQPSFEKLELDVGRTAFGPDVTRVPSVNITHPSVQVSAWDEFFTPRQPTPVGVRESLAWLRFKQRAADMNVIVQETGGLLRLNQPGIAAPVIPQSMFLGLHAGLLVRGELPMRLPPPADGSYRTYPILALRAARRAIAENPDHPDGFFALSQAVADRDFPIGDGDRSVSLASAYQQCLTRLPKPADFRRNVFASSPSQVAVELAKLYLGRPLGGGEFQGHRVDMGAIGELARGGILLRIPGSPATGNRAVVLRVPPAAAAQMPAGSQQLAEGLYILPLDLAQQLLATAEEYAKKEFIDPEVRSSELAKIADLRKTVDAAHRKALDQYRTAADRSPKLKDRHQLAIRYGLVGEALNLLNSGDLSKEFAEEEVTIFFHLVALELATGRFEDASVHLATLRNFINDLTTKPNVNRNLLATYKRFLAELEYQKLVLEGNYAEAGKELESLEGTQIGIDELLAALAKAKIDPTAFKERERVVKVVGQFNDAWPMFAMLGIPAYGPGEPLWVATAQWKGYLQLDQIRTLENARQALAAKMQRDSEFFFRRGFLALLEGDIAGAKARFTSAARPAPPPAWDVPPVRHVDAELFLKQIERAEKAKKP